MYTPINGQRGTTHMGDEGSDFTLSPYPIDFSSFCSSSALVEAGMIANVGNPARHDPCVVARSALVNWNQYLITDDEVHRKAFLTQALWLVNHEVRIGDDAGGWPISSPHPDVAAGGQWLSALTQGLGVSVLVRSFHLTREKAFLEAARLAVRTFERDILDGGVSTPIGSEGIFFEEVAVYPATHTFSGCVFALLGLFDYRALTADVEVEQLVQRSLATMHDLLDEYDVGYWTRPDLLHRRLASHAQLVLQGMLLEVLSKYSLCNHCSMLASRWKDYPYRFGSRLRSSIASRTVHFGSVLLRQVRALLIRKVHTSPAPHRATAQSPLHVCAPITAFPVTGGMRTALAAVAQVTRSMWRMEYVTQHVGPNPEQLKIHRFGSAVTSPWQFPGVWLYNVAGCSKLISLLRDGAGFHLIIPQDGVFTAPFAAIAAKLAGVRVVCMDYGNMTLLQSPTYRSERLKTLASRRLPCRLVGTFLYLWYWPSLYLLSWLATRFVDHFLVAGIAGDGVEEVYVGRLGVHRSRITRYAYMIDIDHHVVLDAASRARLRARYGIAANALVITMICRLAPEKGLDIAFESISQALSMLSPEQSARVRLVIAGDGPLRKHVEEDISRRSLNSVCLLWGEASRIDVNFFLSISDIFLHTSTRGAYYTLSILEAMASACALVASTEPSLNVQLLAEGRGRVVPAGDAEQTARALVQVLNDPELRLQMGKRARDYIAVQHSADQFRRTLMRVTYWSALDEFLSLENGK